jgi:tetratricopeptide (TPR) repeat protein
MKKNLKNPRAVGTPQKTKPDAKTVLGKIAKISMPYLVLSAVIFGVYFHTLSYGLINLDDDKMIKESLANVKSISSISEVFLRDALFSRGGPYYRPLLPLSFIINKVTTGDSLFYYHLTNLILHMILSCLLLTLLRLTSINSSLSLLLALIFGIHPLFAGAVVWLTARAELLVSIFLVSSLMMLVKYEEMRETHYLLFHIPFFALALFSKELAIVAPLLFLCHLTRFRIRGLIKKENAFLILSWILIIIPYLILRNSVTGGQEAAKISSFITNLPYIPEILCKFIFPFDLSGMPTYNYLLVSIGCLLLAGIGIALFRKRKESCSWLLFGLSWALVFSLPGMFARQPGIGVFDYFETRAYLAMIGMVVFVGSVLNSFLSEKTNRYYVFILIPVAFGVQNIYYSRIYSAPLRFYDSVIEKGTKVALPYNNRGLIKHELRDNAGAMLDYDRAIEMKPDFPEAYNNRGSIKHELLDRQGAILDFSRAIEIKPDYAEAYFNRGNIRNELLDRQGAVGDYDRAIDIKSDFADAYFNRGAIKTELLDKSGAMLDYDRAIKIRPDFREACFNRGLLKHELHDSKGAMLDYDRAIEIDAGYGDAYNNRGKVRQEMGDRKGAMLDYDQAIKMKGDYAEAYFNRGVTRAELLDKQGAMRDYDRAIEIKPDFADAYRNRGKIRHETGNNEGAILDYDRAVEIRPDYAEAYHNRGLIKRELHDKKGALLDFTKAIEIKGDFREAYFDRANIRSELADIQGAMRDYNRAIEIDPRYASAYNNLGACYLSTKDYERSISCFEKAIELKPDFADAIENLEIAKRLLNGK